MEQVLVSTTTASHPSWPEDDDIPVLDISDQQPPVSEPRSPQLGDIFVDPYENQEFYPSNPRYEDDDPYHTEEPEYPSWQPTGLRSAPASAAPGAPFSSRPATTPVSTTASASSLPTRTSFVTEEPSPASPPRRSNPQRIRRRTGVALERNAIRRERKQGKRSTSYKCRVCDLRLTSRKALFEHQGSRRHRNKANLPSEAARTCIPCNQVFESLDHLGRHQRGKRHLAVVSRR